MEAMEKSKQREMETASVKSEKTVLKFFTCCLIAFH